MVQEVVTSIAFLIGVLNSVSTDVVALVLIFLASVIGHRRAVVGASLHTVANLVSGLDSVSANWAASSANAFETTLNNTS